MRVLVLAERNFVAKPYVDALKAKGIKANYLRLLKVSLVSKHKNTLIKSAEENIPKYDAVFLQARTTLTPFIEPLLEELKSKGIYCNAAPGSYFLGSNEPYKFVNLAINKIKTPRTFIAGPGKNIERVSKRISYPLTAKSYKGKNVQQSTIVNNDVELNNFVNSIRSEIDGFMLREYVDANLISCVVIGKKVFAIERKLINGKAIDLEKGYSCSIKDVDLETVIGAAKVCGLDIARVDIVNGNVVAVEPNIPIEIFNKICSANLEDNIANFIIEKVNEVGAKTTVGDELRDIADKLSNTILSRFVK